MIRINTLIKKASEREFIICIVLLNLLSGVLAIITDGRYYFAPDSLGYHAYAVNIVNGNGYSVYSEAPYYINMSREPGYNIFLAGIYRMASIAGPIEHVNGIYNLERGELTEIKTEIQTVKYIQCLLLLVNILLFYVISRKVFTISIARWATILTSLYYPYMTRCIYLLREPLVALLVTVVAYTLVLYITQKKLIYAFLTAITIGIASLTWQAMIVLFPILMVLTIIRETTVRRRVVSVLVCSITYVAVLSPWLIFAYSYYPDVRIYKTVGISLTHEVMDYASAIMEANYQGYIDDEQPSIIFQREIYSQPSDELFRRSFEGWFTAQADSIREELSQDPMARVKYFASTNIRRLREMLVHNKWSPYRDIKAEAPVTIIINMIWNIIGVLVAIGFIYGIVVLPKRKLLYYMPYCMLIAIYNIIGSEGRRFLPIIPFMILVMTYGISNIASKYGEKEAVRPK